MASPATAPPAYLSLTYHEVQLGRIWRWTARVDLIPNYTVVAAASGSDALEILKDQANRIDLALLDVMMPGLNGIELAKRIEGMQPNMLRGLCPDSPLPFEPLVLPLAG